MALPFGKLTILVGAGLLGSVLAKEGHLPDVSGLVSGAFKIALKQIRSDDSTASIKKPRNEFLVSQVNSLREELQMLASSRSITIVTSSSSGASRYGFVVVIVVIGYGYVWWKGWKLPDFMFATRRSLADARESIAKQLESVYTSITATKRHFSSKLDGIDHTLDDIRAVTESTDSEVSALLDRTDNVSNNVNSFAYAVREMESKIKRIEEKQDPINEGLTRLLNFAAPNLENSKKSRNNEALLSTPSRPALEPPPISPSRAGSLPAAISSEPMYPSTSSGSHVVQKPLRSTVSSSGLRDFNEKTEMTPSTSAASNGSSMENTNTGSSTSSGLFGLKIPRTPFLMRTHSAATSFKLSPNHQPQ